MSYSSRVYRHRNAHANDHDNDNEQSSFFNKSEKQAGGAKKSNAFFQAKLSVNEPGDKYEREADSVASAVVNNSGSPAVQQKEISGIQRLATAPAEEAASTDEERMKRDKDIQTKPQIQQKCAECEQEEKEKGAVQAKSNDSGGGTASARLSSRVTSSAGKGNAMPANTLNEMNTSFGANFNDVNIHTDTASAEMNDELGAQAFTHGNDIYFNAGKFNPETSSGKHLLAHELTHVVQQDGDSGIKKKIMPYRKSGAFRFNAKHPKATDSLKEEEFTDEKKQPWLEKITVDFNTTASAGNNDIMPQGTLTGTYFKNKANAADFTHTVTGGGSSIGFTDKGKSTVHRIEGAGYNDTVEKDGVGPKKHYDKNVAGGSMSYAVFFKGKQALHAGDPAEGSHACVHVNWNKINQIRRINFHSVIGKTEVEINYTNDVLNKICCDRRKQEKVKDSDLLPNPCNNVKGSSCKGGGGGGGGKTGSLCVPIDIVAASFQNEETEHSSFVDERNDEDPSGFNSDLTGLKLNDGLYYGTWDKRPRVHKLQERLTLKGFFAKSDGMFGPKTLAALQGFQETNFLPPTEIVDPETARLLESNESPTCPKGFMPVPNDLFV